MKDAPTLRQLRAFVAVYRHGRLSSAADSLSITQPAVSVLLKELEDRLGMRLFDRTTRSLQRTAAADEAVRHAERVLAEVDQMGSAMRALAHGSRGRVRIAATSTIAQTLVPEAMKRHAAAHPGVEVTLDDCAPGEFVDRIESDRVDFGIGTLDGPMPGLQEQVLVRDHLSVIASSGVSFVHPTHITWGQLATLPLITVKPGYGVRGSIDRAAAAAGVVLNVAHEVNLLGTALAMTAAGLGVSVLPPSILRHGAFAGLVSRRLMRPTVARDVAVVTRAGRSLSAAARAFIAMLAADACAARQAASGSPARSRPAP